MHKINQRGHYHKPASNACNAAEYPCRKPYDEQDENIVHGKRFFVHEKIMECKDRISCAKQSEVERERPIKNSWADISVLPAMRPIQPHKISKQAGTDPPTPSGYNRFALGLKNNSYRAGRAANDLRVQRVFIIIGRFACPRCSHISESYYLEVVQEI